ncbi:MAG: hypothetical protein ACRD1M_17890 [Terriglobales bacterium]
MGILLEVTFVALLRRPAGAPPAGLLVWLAAAALFYLIAVTVVLRGRTPISRRTLRFVLLAAVVFRITLLPVTPSFSRQLWRFRWDGYIQHLGFNPYAYAPDNSLFRPIRPPGSTPIPEPAMAGFHPPAAELLFHWSYDWSAGLRSQKLLFVVFDLLVLLLLLRVLKSRRLPAAWVVIYAWSPLAVFEVAGAGHIEPAAALLLLALLYMAEYRPRIAGILLATAAMTQWYALALAPRLLQAAGRRWRSTLAWLVVWPALLSLPYLFYSQHLALARMADNIRAHARAAAPFNASLWALWSVGGSTGAAVLSATAVIAAIVAAGWRRLPPLRAGFLIVSTLLLVMPQLPPWHMLWLLPLVAIFPDPGWIWLSVAVLAAYALGPHPWLVWVEYVPLYGWLAWRGFHRAGANDGPGGAGASGVQPGAAAPAPAPINGRHA